MGKQLIIDSSPWNYRTSGHCHLDFNWLPVLETWASFPLTTVLQIEKVLGHPKISSHSPMSASHGFCLLPCHPDVEVKPFTSDHERANPQHFWVELHPAKIHMLKSYHLVPQNVTIFGNGVFVNAVKLRWGHAGIGWASSPVQLVSL